MKKILQSDQKAFYEEFNLPSIGDDEILVKTLYSFVSSGTESANFKSSLIADIQKNISSTQNNNDSYDNKNQFLDKSKIILELAKKAVNNPKKAIYYAINKLPKKAIEYTINKVSEKTTKQAETTTKENLKQNEIFETNFKFGFPLGYSAVGEVIEKGKNILDFSLGDIVSCSGAEYANHGEFILVKKNFCVKIPKDCPIEYAATTTLGSIAMNSVRRANPQVGDNVGLVGFGLLGTLTYEILKNTSANIFAFDINKDRFKNYDNEKSNLFSNEWDDYKKKIFDKTKNHGLDKIIIAAADKKSKIIDKCLKIIRKKGQLILLGDVLLDFERNDFYKKEIDLLISTSYGPGRYDDNYEKKSLDYPYHYVRWTFNRNMEAYLKLIEQSKVNVKSIIDKRVKFEELSDFYNNKGFENYKGVLVEYPKLHETKNKISKIFKNSEKSNNKNFLHCGLGAYSKSTLIPLFKSKNYTVSGVVSNNHLNSAEYLNENKISNIYPNLNNYFSDKKNTDSFVVIANKHNEHHKYVIDCVKNSMNVFIEKPLAISWDQINLLQTAINSKDELPILFVNFNRKFSNHSIKLRKIISDQNSQCFLNYNIFSKKLDDNNWLNDEKIGGGRNLGEAIHMYDLCKYLIQKKIMSVNAFSFNNNQNSIFENKQNFSVNLKFVDGSIANINYFTCASDYEPKETIEVRIKNKTFIIENFKNLVELQKDKKETIYKTQEIDKGHKDSINFFLNAIEGKKEFEISRIQDDIETTKLALYVDKLIT